MMSELTEMRNRMRQAAVLVVGDAMLDRYWFGEVDRVSPEAPVPIVRVTREEYRAGGAANVAVNCASLGARATLAAVIGKDAAGGVLTALLSDHDVMNALISDPSITTTTKLRVSGRSQQLLRVDFEAEPTPESLDDLSETVKLQMEGHNVVIFSDYGKGGLSEMQSFLSLAKQHRIPAIVDPKGKDYSIYQGASALTPNRSEFEAVVGRWTSELDFEAKGLALREELDLEALIVTRSEEGISLFDSVGHMHFCSQTREVFDVTGAGDTVIATLATLIATGVSFRDAVEVANRAGGIAVGKFGTAAVTIEELFV